MNIHVFITCVLLEWIAHGFIWFVVVKNPVCFIQAVWNTSDQITVGNLSSNWYFEMITSGAQTIRSQ